MDDKDSQRSRPMSEPIHLASVWTCADVGHAERLMDGEGFVYQRQGHPNAQALAERLAERHSATRAAVTGTGMSALALAALATLRQGDHVLVADRLYGTSEKLWTLELRRLGITASRVDARDADAVRAALTPQTRLVVAETIDNPMLGVIDVAALADAARQRGAQLLVDNTFASPVLCRPLELGASWAMESVSKIINGHSDVMLGALCAGDEVDWERVETALCSWGLLASPLECWLTSRGLETLELRVERACQNAARLARWLADDPRVQRVAYPGLPDHPQHELAERQFRGRFGWMIALHLADREAADRFIGACHRQGSVPFAPSLGETRTTLSHPPSTSHRHLSAAERSELGIGEGTLRLSVGVEDHDRLQEVLEEALGAA